MKYLINDEFIACKEFVLQIQKHFYAHENFIHKARNEIKNIPYKKYNFSIKSFKTLNILRSFIYSFLKPSKAKKSYLNSIKIAPFSPKAVAYIEFYKFGLIIKSYFISEQFKYDFTIREVLLDKNFDDKYNILKDFASFTCKLHEANIFHDDYSPGNILIRKTNNNYEFKIVDINRMKFFKFNLKQRMKNLSKLWANDDDLTIIAQNYAKIINKNEKHCVDLALYFSNKHKNFMRFKKRLKGQKIVD